MTNISEGEKLRADHRDICGQLNIDAATEEQSWNSFQATQKAYNLDVDQLHWLGCALFIICRKKVTPTVGNTNSVLQGNCVSMTRLLRLCKINLHEFFKKIDQWMSMTSQPEACRNAISSLQHNFVVAMLIYQKFRDVFPTIFVAPSEEEQRRGKKSKPQPCTPEQLYKFCWKLFICAKAEYPDQKGDLVKSYNMLLCCLDLVYANVIADGRTDLVNPSFAGLPEDFISPGIIPEEPVCIIEHIKEDNCSSAIMDIRDNIWRNTIQNFSQTNVLRGDAETLLGFITVANFEYNLKSLDSTYNTFILSNGEFDESIALEQKTTEGSFFPSVKSELSMSGTPERIPLYQQTPLNSRTRSAAHHVTAKFTPISTANASVAKLRMKLIISNSGEGQSSFKELLRTCNPDPSNILAARVGQLQTKFVKHMLDQNWNPQAIASRWDMIQTLYYRLLELIIRAERKRLRVNIVKELCCEEMFNQTLLVCSAEIVSFAHNLQHNFPLILTVFDMPPFIFYRIIEMVVKHHNDLLSGEIIKYLTIIENQCIESLVWKSSSPLWDGMKNIGYKVPYAKDVECSIDLSGITPHKSNDSASKTNCQQKLESTPSTSTSTPSSNNGQPVRKAPNPDSAKKRLFLMDGDEPSKTETPGNEPMPETEASQEKKDTPKESTAAISFMSPFKAPIPNGSASKRKPGSSSLNLFFRKYYSTAALRMRHLCAQLRLSSEMMVEIWNIFEYSVVKCTKELICDRHLDQMVMCSIYLYARIKKHTKMFADIMKAYRTLPQSYSHVYRSVFISRGSAEQQSLAQQDGPNSNIEGGTESRRVLPGDMAGVSVQHGDEERGDIIRFYNTVYITKMQDLVTQFGSEDGRSLMLSPLPKTTNRCLLQSPKKIDYRYSLYVTPREKSSDLKESPNAIKVQLCPSPAKSHKLQQINQLVKSAPPNSCKRSLSDLESYEQPTMKPKCRKLDRLLSDRQQQESNVNPK